jgi:hypothetical protein
MAVRRSYTPTLRYSTDYNYRLQTAPPLSFQQYARSVMPLPGAPPWQATGKYHPPILHSYLSPELRKLPGIPSVQPWIYSYRRKYSIPTYTLKQYKDKKPLPPEPIWHPPGPYRSKVPTSLSPEKRLQQPIHEPVWQPIGRIHHKPVPYFDPPNLRWSLQQLMRSMPDLKTRCIHSSTSTSVMRNQYTEHL